MVYFHAGFRFNYVACDNNFEADFAKFLDRAEDIEAFISLHKIGFFMEYIDSEGNFHLGYYPDFIAKLKNGEFFLIETKGREDVDVKAKDSRAVRWCEDATKITGKKWFYIRVNQEDFEKYRLKSIKELTTTFKK